MNTDHYTEIGSTHIVCQDYALSGSYKNMAYAIVSDGCSSSKHSEIGAQILCHCAKYYLQYLAYKVTKKVFGDLIIKRASQIASMYNLPKSALDATLIVAYMIDDRATVVAYGDGYIKMLFDGFSLVYNLSYSMEAPAYLSYLLNQEKYNTYLKEFKDNKFLIDEDPDPDSPYTHFDTSFPGVKAVLISSDGINSYHKNAEKIDVKKDFSSYKRTTGEFVKSNMLFHKRKMQKEGIQHHDDISVAVIDSRSL